MTFGHEPTSFPLFSEGVLTGRQDKPKKYFSIKLRKNGFFGDIVQHDSAPAVCSTPTLHFKYKHINIKKNHGATIIYSILNICTNVQCTKVNASGPAGISRFLLLCSKSAFFIVIEEHAREMYKLRN
jgi:hypothetical protein